MYPTLALQAAALAFALLLSAPASLQPADGTPRSVVQATAPADPHRLHCRLYFGCAPVQKASAERAED
jgi:hypothetical protein